MLGPGSVSMCMTTMAGAACAEAGTARTAATAAKARKWRTAALSACHAPDLRALRRGAADDAAADRQRARGQQRALELAVALDAHPDVGDDAPAEAGRGERRLGGEGKHGDRSAQLRDGDDRPGQHVGA